MAVLGYKDKSPNIQDFHRCNKCGMGSFLEAYVQDPETNRQWEYWQCPYCGNIQSK